MGYFNSNNDAEIIDCKESGLIEQGGRRTDIKPTPSARLNVR